MTPRNSPFDSLMGLSLPGTLERLDRWHGSRPVAAIPVAVVKKFGDDRARRHAALIAYYRFFSLFPLLLVLVSLLGFALQNDPELQKRILDSALAQFPVIGPQIESNIGALTGSFVTLAVGLATARGPASGDLRHAGRDGRGLERREARSTLVRALEAAGAPGPRRRGADPEIVAACRRAQSLLARLRSDFVEE